MENAAGLIFDDSVHYLDHLAPFCALYQLPLILFDPKLIDLAKKFYPDVKVLEQSFASFSFPSNLICCDPPSLIKGSFGLEKTQVFWLPHGASEKGRKAPFFNALIQEDVALVYGQKMVDLFKENKVPASVIRIGNFRDLYYQKHKSFYERLLLKKKNHFLYAPTWDDAEKNNSFWQSFSPLVQRLPTNAHLTVKLHPNTLHRFAPEIERILGKSEGKNIDFLFDFPPIYPLLDKVDAFIGDMSSIGFDFLHFLKPMYFLNFDPELSLHQVGEPLDLQTFSYTLYPLCKIKAKKLYDYTFDKPLTPSEMDEKLCSSPFWR